MNSSGRLDSFSTAILKNIITFAISLIINCINGAFVYTYFKSQVFQRDPRYILYIHLVINDMILLTLSVLLQIVIYTGPVNMAACCFLLVLTMTTNRNSPLNLAGMAVERYIAICCPLHHVQICTVQRAHTLIPLIWAMSSIPALCDVIIILSVKPLSVFSQSVICHMSYVYHTPHHTANTMYTLITLLVLVCLTLVTTYLRVLCTAQALSRSTRDSARNAHSTILLHGVQLLLCMLSYVAPFSNSFFSSIWPQQALNILFMTFLLTNVLPRLLSPLIYGARDKKFSKHIRLHFFCKCCSRAGQRASVPTGPTGRSNKLSP